MHVSKISQNNMYYYLVDLQITVNEATLFGFYIFKYTPVSYTYEYIRLGYWFAGWFGLGYAGGRIPSVDL